MKKVILSLALALSLFCTTAVAANFTDVPTTHTFYTEISQAVEAGYFNGTSDTTYDPGGTITNKQFLVVVGRVLGLTDSSEYIIEDTLSKLKQAGIITGYENFASDSNIGEAMSRESMAYVMANVLEYTGEELNDFTISSSRIPDYAKIGTDYSDEVLLVYSNGILMGDTQGYFNPKENLSRGAAAAVIMRLVDSSNRSDVLSDTEYYAAQIEELAEQAATTVQTIYESTNSYRTPAKEGDTYVKSDGTTVTLVRDSNGVLMGSDGSYVAADLGMKSQVDTVRSGDAFNFETELNGAGIYVDYYDNSLQNQIYYVLANGMGIWNNELNILQSKITAPSYSGTDGEVSSDIYGLYIWYDMFGCWMLNR